MKKNNNSTDNDGNDDNINIIITVAASILNTKHANYSKTAAIK